MTAGRRVLLMKCLKHEFSGGRISRSRYGPLRERVGTDIHGPDTWNVIE